MKWKECVDSSAAKAMVGEHYRGDGMLEGPT